jgi:hypothetical protein
MKLIRWNLGSFRNIHFPSCYMYVIFTCCFISNTYMLSGQDPRERYYNYQILEPSHADKPKVEGWAENRVEEKINRGLVAVKDSQNRVYLSWRLLKTDQPNVTFNIYRALPGKQAIKLNNRAISQTTDFLDLHPVKGTNVEYWIVPVINGKEITAYTKYMLKADTVQEKYIKSIKFRGKYLPDRIAISDLNGDGEYDYIIKQPMGQVDPGVWKKSPESYKIEAYLSDGTFLWQKDLGFNIELGIWYSPFIAYDFNGDGKSEIALKTAPMEPDYRNETGKVFDGPEYCSILNGMTGEEIDRVDWPERCACFGDYNRNNRNQLGMAYLDGKTPCLLVARGTYRMMMLDAYQFKGKKLEHLWRWNGDEENPVIRSQGAHSMHTVDVDNDGRDEVILGSAVIDDDGTLLYSVGVGHSDKCFVTDIDPLHPGMEIFFANEVWHDSLGVCMADAATGKILWNIGHHTQHVGEGMVADIDSTFPGMECFSGEAGKADPEKQNYGGKAPKYMHTAYGMNIGEIADIPDCNDWVYWDADLLREEVKNAGRRIDRKQTVTKYKGNELISVEGRVKVVADIYGDWREELITVLPGEIRIYSTTIPAIDRRICLMQDPLYRSDIVHRSMGYEQSPVTTYYLGVPVIKK